MRFYVQFHLILLLSTFAIKRCFFLNWLNCFYSHLNFLNYIQFNSISLLRLYVQFHLILILLLSTFALLFPFLNTQCHQICLKIWSACIMHGWEDFAATNRYPHLLPTLAKIFSLEECYCYVKNRHNINIHRKRERNKNDESIIFFSF